MLENNNKRIIRELAKKTGKQNRIRNLVLWNTVILVTILFTAILTVCVSMAENMTTMFVREHGTRETATVTYPTKEQVLAAREMVNVRAAGVTIMTGEVSDLSGVVEGELVYYDTEEFEEHIMPAISHIEGRYPTKENEIMLPRNAKKQLHLEDAQIGDKVTLLRGGERETFVLCGWFQEYVYRSYDFRGLVSEAYCDKHGYTMEKNGLLCFSAPFGYMYAMMEHMALPKVGWEQFWSTNIDQVLEGQFYPVLAILITLLLAALLMICGFLLIYNVMQISIGKDIRYYGLLKTIGMTSSQVHSMVMRQAVFLSVTGAGIGMMLGSLLSFCVVPPFLNMFDNVCGAMPYTISSHPFIYLGAILFIWITVYISFRKPAKFAAGISPIQAQKYQEQESYCMKKKSKSGGKLYKLAYRNVFRQKKKAIMVFVSLFLGIGVYLGINTFVGGLKPENYTESYNPFDYTLLTYREEDDKEDLKLITQEEKENAARTLSLAKKLKETEGVKKVCVHQFVYCRLDFDEDLFWPFLEQDFLDEEEREEAIENYKKAENPSDTYDVEVIAVDKEVMKRYNKQAVQPVDIDAFERGEVCVLGYTDTEEQAEAIKGKQITLHRDQEGTRKTFTIGSCMSGEYAGKYATIWYHSYSSGAPMHILVSETALAQLSEDTVACSIWMDCVNEEEEPEITATVKKVARESGVVVQSIIKSEHYQMIKTVTGTIRRLGEGIGLVFLFVGIVNFIHVFLTSVYGRRQELAMMESVGMTKRQVRKLLLFEGMYYAAVESLMILTMGGGLVYGIGKYTMYVADYGVLCYPYKTVIVLLVLVWLLCLCVPVFVYQSISKESITERIRRGE